MYLGKAKTGALAEVFGRIKRLKPNFPTARENNE